LAWSRDEKEDRNFDGPSVHQLVREMNPAEPRVGNAFAAIAKSYLVLADNEHETVKELLSGFPVMKCGNEHEVRAQKS